MSDLTLSAESAGTTIFGATVSDLQTGVTVGDNAITGTIKYFDTPGEIVDYWGAGNFFAFKVSNIDSNAVSAKVGLEPSAGSGLVEIINDPDKNGIAKITNKATQKFKVVQTDAEGHEKVQLFDLSGLTLEGE